MIPTQDRQDAKTALVIVDVQHDFLPGGALGVPHGDEVIAEIERFVAAKAPGMIVATRDNHPSDHCSFDSQGGIWPAHCVQGTPGAEIHPRIQALKPRTISKGENPAVEQYSGFAGTHLATMLRAEGFDRVVVCGLATDYCVKATTLDALADGFDVDVLTPACRGVDVNAGDSARALAEMESAGAHLQPALSDLDAPVISVPDDGGPEIERGL